ncbi:MAG: permease-like cell division protein FtsX [Bacteroidales bacterium]|nr:permease-like cell division protein FtsX [Bacteroidales bacterium]
MKKRKHQSSFAIQSLSAGISITMVLLLLGLMVFCMLSAHTLSRYVRENIGFSVVLSNDMKKPEALKLHEQLSKMPFVKEATFISKEDALQEQTVAMGTDPSEFLGFNPFSASIEIKLNAAWANNDSIAWIEKQIKLNNGVISINYPQDLLDSVNTNIQKISILLLGTAILLTLISFSLINNTIHLTIYSKRFLIHTMKLVGAGWGFIRRPFIVHNLKIGVFSAIVADIVLGILAGALLRYDADLKEIVTTTNLFIVFALVMLSGICISVLCAYFSMNKYLRMKADDLYYI